MAKNLCFYCNQKYVLGHKCNGQMFSLEVLVDNGYDNGEEEFFLPDYTAQPSQKDTEELIEYTPQISLHALSALTTLWTLVQLRGWCRILATVPLQVDVADGNKILSTSVYKNFICQLQGERFQTDVMLVSLGGCEMVLGVQWLASLGNIQ
ncbi:hypothetical protein Tco_1435737 [Tanacetum coccineum]